MLGPGFFLLAVLTYLLLSDKLQTRITPLPGQWWIFVLQCCSKRFFSPKQNPPSCHAVWKRWRLETCSTLEAGPRIPTWTALPTAGSRAGFKRRSRASGFTSHVGSGAVSQHIYVKAWESSSVSFYKIPGESMEMDFYKCRTHMCKLNTFFLL